MNVIPGLEILLRDRLDLLRGKRIGILSNPTSVDRGLRHIVDLLWNHREVVVTALMGPQHGARGETQDNMIEWRDYRDSVTSLPVFSLYSHTRRPTPEMLGEIDTLVIDLQDVGARIYTYIYSMAMAMEACREVDVEVIVLDRPNPINGADVEGPVLEPEFSSFVGLHPLPIRHGLTIAELARYFNEEMGIGCRLEVVPMSGWRRHMFFAETGLPWVIPSPNLPTPDTALVYPGVVLFEGTNLSEGRGTTRPFELSGAPWVRPERLLPLLEDLDLDSVTFRPVFTVPTFHKWAGDLLGGVQIHVTDRRNFKPFRTGLGLLLAYRSLDSDRFEWRAPPYEYEFEKLPFDILCGTDSIRLQIEAGCDLESIESSWKADLDRFKRIRSGYLLY